MTVADTPKGYMQEYFKREITYDSDTQNYKVSVPELGIEILSDTEVGGLVDVRDEVQNYLKNMNPGLHKVEEDADISDVILRSGAWFCSNETINEDYILEILNEVYNRG